MTILRTSLTEFLITLTLILHVTVQANDDVTMVFNCQTGEPTSSASTVHDPTTSPAVIHVQSTTFYPGQEITVNLFSRYPLRSYILQARSGTVEGPVGSFPQYPHATTCINPSDTIYYNNDIEYVTKVQVIWTSTSDASLPSQIYFRASIITADNQIWTDIKSYNIRKINENEQISASKKTEDIKTVKVALPPVVLRSNATPSAEYIKRQSVIEERIASFRTRKQELLDSEDLASEGGSQELVRQKAANEQNFIDKIAQFNKLKLAEINRQQDLLRFEIEDREAHQEDQLGASGPQSTPSPLSPTTNQSGNGSGKLGGTNNLIVILALCMSCLFVARKIM